MIYGETRFIISQLIKIIRITSLGKTIQSELVRNLFFITTYQNDMCGNHYDAQRLCRSPKLRNVNIINENLVTIELERMSKTFDRPVHLGFSILEVRFHNFRSQILLFLFTAIEIHHD